MRLKNHCLARLANMDIADEDLTFNLEDRQQLRIENDSLYSHGTAQINYTTYDVRRDRDVVKSSGDRCDIILPSYDNGGHPFWYARVIGIYHLRVTHAPTNTVNKRIEFLWVRWFGLDPQWRGGHSHYKLDRIGFVPYGGPDEPFGFVNPDSVIRACHLIPAFEFGRTMDLLPESIFRPKDGDYINYYVNRYNFLLNSLTSRTNVFVIYRFVDRDMLMRYLGVGVGHGSDTRASPSTENSDELHGHVVESEEFGDLPLEADDPVLEDEEEDEEECSSSEDDIDFLLVDDDLAATL